MWGSAILQPIVFNRYARISTVWGATIGSRFNVAEIPIVDFLRHGAYKPCMDVHLLSKLTK